VKRYKFIEEHRARYPIAKLTEVMGISRSGYYDWRQRPMSARQQHRLKLTEHVHAAYVDHHGIYGSRKIAAELVEQNVQVCRNTVAKLMREKSLQSKAQKRRAFTVTTDSNHTEPIAPNLLDRNFTASEPNEKWVADITYVATNEGWAYMAAVMDLYSRRIVGWSVSDSLETSLVLDALHQAIETRRPNEGLLHHSDRGCQYASCQYRELLELHGIQCSMSGRGDCWDNACMERFMNSFKNEWVKHRSYATVESLHHSGFEYIEIFYNRKRRHQALGYVSPVQYEATKRGNNAA